MGLLSVVELLTLVLGLAAVVLAVRSYLRFVEGEFKTMLRWVVYALLLFVIYNAVDVVAMRLSFLRVLSKSLFLLAMVCVLVGVGHLYRFSEVFGFREHRMPHHKVKRR